MSSPARWHGLRPRRKRSSPPMLEDLESRVVLSLLMPIIVPRSVPAGPQYAACQSASGTTPLDFGSPTPVGYTPAQIRTAYGINNVIFGTVTGDGTGQTIAIVDAYDDPAFVNSTDPNFSTSDLAQFDQAVRPARPAELHQVQRVRPDDEPPRHRPGRRRQSQRQLGDGGVARHRVGPRHRPGASIDLVEASNDTNNTDIFTAVTTAAGLPGVSVVSMSWGIDEYSGEQAVDSTFTTPSGHQGVTFIAASGDPGSPGYYPAYSPNVLATGGTTLILNANNTIQSETAWSGSGGGTSQYEPEPAYQQGFQGTGKRTIPDVAWDADPNTGVAIYDSYDDTDGIGAWYEIGGTSVAAPSWSGLIAIANQGRAIEERRQPRRADPDPAGHLLRAGHRLQRHHQRQQRRLLRRAGLRRGHRPGHAHRRHAGPRPGRLRRGQPARRHGAAAGQVIAGDQFGVVVSAEDPGGPGRPVLQRHRDPRDGQRPDRRGPRRHAHRDGQPRRGGLRRPEHQPARHRLYLHDRQRQVRLGHDQPLRHHRQPDPRLGDVLPGPDRRQPAAAIAAADSNGDASNTIVLSASTYVLTDTTPGQIVIQNSSSLAGKTLTIVGQGEGRRTIIQPGITRGRTGSSRSWARPRRA